MESNQHRCPQHPGDPQSSLLGVLFPFSCSFCSAGLLTADLCPVLALGVSGGAFLPPASGEKGREEGPGARLWVQSRDSTHPCWGCHRSDPAQGQDVGL